MVLGATLTATAWDRPACGSGLGGLRAVGMDADPTREGRPLLRARTGLILPLPKNGLMSTSVLRLAGLRPGLADVTCQEELRGSRKRLRHLRCPPADPEVKGSLWTWPLSSVRGRPRPHFRDTVSIRAVKQLPPSLPLPGTPPRDPCPVTPPQDPSAGPLPSDSLRRTPAR